MIELTYPWFLILLFGLGFFWLPLRNTTVTLHPAQRRIVLAVRLSILAATILALAGPKWRMPSDRLAVVYLVDASASVAPEARTAARHYVEASVKNARFDDDYAVIGFAETSEIWRAFGAGTSLSDWPELKNRQGTDYRDALQFAASILPKDRRRKIVLLSDGNDTSGEGGASVAELARMGIEFDAVALQNPDSPEVLVESVQTPRNIAPNEPFDLTAVIRSTIAQTGTIRLYENQYLLQQRQVNLRPGPNPVRFENLTSEGSQFEVEVQAPQDTFAENNFGSAVVQIGGQPHVLLVDPDESRLEPLAGVLRNERFQVETRTQAGVPKSIDDLDRFDLVLFSDVSALTLSSEQMELLRTWVRDFGGAFVLAGGENSFGVGGYYRTPVEQMLPVRMEHDDRQQTPSVALLVVLDRSGSMAAQVQGRTKISLADQGAVLAMNVLKDNDFFGVFAVDTKVHEVVPLARLQERQQLQQSILGIDSSGGGIYIFTSLVAAARALREVNAQIKHLILFSDAADAEEKFAGEMGEASEGSGTAFDVVSNMLASRTTTSVVGLGYESDKDVPFLKLLAERGNGRFYLTNDPMNLPQIFTTETMKVAQSSLIEEPFQAQVVRDAKVLEGISWSQSPLLLGYNSTKLKPAADLLLATETGAPLFASWRFGLGQTAAFTSDVKSRWASEWLRWNGFGKFWTQAVRTLMRRTDRGQFQVDVQENGDRLRVNIDAVRPDGSFANELSLSVVSADANGRTDSASATQIGPGRYVASLPLPERGVRLISVSTPNAPPVTWSYTRSYPKEFLETRTNRKALGELTQISRGRLDPKENEIFQTGPLVPGRRIDLAPWLLALAATLLPLDVFLRRRPYNRDRTLAGR
jgi:Ca-activated chloride channel family protein